MHFDYNIPAMRELRDQQVRFAPREKKLEQLDRAEKLIAEIDPGVPTRTPIYVSGSRHFVPRLPPTLPRRVWRR